MKLTAVHTHVFKENADLPLFIKDYIPSLEENTVLAVASKLVCLWLGLSVPYQNAAQKEALIKKESSAALKTPLAWLTIKAGMVMTNAGVDESNAQGKLLLLPKDCYRAAADLRARLQTVYGIKNLGVLITDSMILPLRAGVVAGAVLWLGEGAYFPCLLAVELAVVGIEAWVYRLLLGLPWNRALGWSAGLNAFSCLAGLVIF